MIAPCKDCLLRHPACHDSCEVFSAWKAEREAERAYTKQMNECGRCVPYDHYKDMHLRRCRNRKKDYENR